MVTKYGMSPIGPIILGEHHANPFLGKDLAHERNYSEETARMIDLEVSKLLQKALKQAKVILLKYKKVLHRLAEELIKKETIASEEFEALFKRFQGEGV
jgi:cell division protease FtsH